MSYSITAVVRTASILKDYEAVQRTGRNGTFESKSIMYSVASDRDYKSSITKEDGSVSQERKTDFLAMRASGPIANSLNQYCNTKNQDGKLISRRLLVYGHLETYQTTRKITQRIAVEGKEYDATFDVPETRTIIVVEKFEFLDANPVKNASNATTTSVATVTAVASSAPADAQVAQPAPAQVPVQSVPVAQVSQGAVVAPF